MSKNIICQVVICRFFTNTYSDTRKLLAACMQNDIFNTIMPSGTSFPANTQLSRGKRYIIIDDDQLFFRINFVKIHTGTDTFAAQVHISLWF